MADAELNVFTIARKEELKLEEELISKHSSKKAKVAA